MHIHVQWNGPYTYEDALKLKDEFIDYGVYQIYGAHPIYGSDVLIYIGKADQQTFSKRLSQHTWVQGNSDSSRVRVYIGRLSGYDGTPNSNKWSKQIEIVERLLIIAHKPSANSSGLNVELSNDYHDVHILNWGEYRNVLPEVSGARYSDKYDSAEGYNCYGESRRPG